MKEDVEKSIAPKEETIVEVELTEMQREYYKQIYEVPPSILVFYLFFLILSLSLSLLLIFSSPVLLLRLCLESETAADASLSATSRSWRRARET